MSTKTKTPDADYIPNECKGPCAECYKRGHRDGYDKGYAAALAHKGASLTRAHKRVEKERCAKIGEIKHKDKGTKAKKKKTTRKTRKTRNAKKKIRR